jgi:predicted kinase
MPSGNATTGPALILLAGFPGAGKTTFGRELARVLPFDCLESDAVRREIFPAPRHTFAESRAVFAEIERRALRALEARRIVLVDATNLREEFRERFAALARRFAAPFILVRVTAPDATIRQRLAGPRVGHSRAGVAVYESMLPALEPTRLPAVCVDTRFPLEPALRLVAALLEESG